MSCQYPLYRRHDRWCPVGKPCPVGDANCRIVHIHSAPVQPPQSTGLNRIRGGVYECLCLVSKPAVGSTNPLFFFFVCWYAGGACKQTEESKWLFRRYPLAVCRGGSVKSYRTLAWLGAVRVSLRVKKKKRKEILLVWAPCD
jgi:hypothetical protein